MHLQVVYTDASSLGGSSLRKVPLDGLSLLTKISDVRTLIAKRTGIAVPRQRLFFRGKQLEDLVDLRSVAKDATLFDYSIKLGDTIQLYARHGDDENAGDAVNGSAPLTPSGSAASPRSALSASVTPGHVRPLYKVGEPIEALDEENAAWFDATVESIAADPACEGGFSYTVRFDDYGDETIVLPLSKMRPRSIALWRRSELQPGDMVFANYNFDEPGTTGFWYVARFVGFEACDAGKMKQARVRLLRLPTDEAHFAEVVTASDLYMLERRTRAPEPSPSPEKREEEDAGAGPSCMDDEMDRSITDEPVPEGDPDDDACDICKKNPKRTECRTCGCTLCSSKLQPEKLLVCDECQMYFHTHCLDPPLAGIPAGDWYCPQCKHEKDIVLAGERHVVSRKKAAMPSATTQSTRDWGRGYACAGRTRVCSIVPPNHFGKIPGVPVGSSWLLRMGASEAGVHRPPVGGIHGRPEEGAFSIVLAGGYEDDEDRGEEFEYTGAGGRDLSGNKRLGKHCKQQELQGTNRALAKNCNAPLSDKGGEAKNWKQGRPVRVLRSAKLAKHNPKYAPEVGCRYDGIYKVVKYWQATGVSGFKVWKYLMRRDDDEPAPWTPEGKRRIEELQLSMVYPVGYDEKMAREAEEDAAKSPAKSPNGKGKRSPKSKSPIEMGGKAPAGSKKKKSSRNGAADGASDPSDDVKMDVDEEDFASPKAANGRKRKAEESPANGASPRKRAAGELDPAKRKLCMEDKLNARVWEELVASFADDGELRFLERVSEAFTCPVCQEIVREPVTTDCSHTCCRLCLRRSIKSFGDRCPYCRADILEEPSLNESLDAALRALLPSYAARAK